jgi:excisionase family DNA binding protein
VPPNLLRLSQLARFWEKNPNTILGWIRQGRLPAIRSPGGHYRVRFADVRAFCEREGMPVPPVVSPASRRVIVWTWSGTRVRSLAPLERADSLARTLRAQGVHVEEHDDPYGALVAASSGAAALLVLPHAGGSFDVAAAVAALRRSAPTRALPIVVMATTARARTGAIERAGATQVLPRSRASELPGLVLEILGPA